MMPINFSAPKLPSPKQLASKDLWDNALIEGKVTKPTVKRGERHYRKMLEAIQNFTVTCGEGTGKTLSQAVDEFQALRSDDGEGWYLIQSKASDTPMAEVRHQCFGCGESYTGDFESCPQCRAEGPQRPDDLTLNCTTCPEDVLKVEFMTWGTEPGVGVGVCDGDNEDKVFAVTLNSDSALKLRDWLNQYLQYSQTQDPK